MTWVGLALVVLLAALGAAVGRTLATTLLTGRVGSWPACPSPSRGVVALVTGGLWALLAGAAVAGWVSLPLLPVLLALAAAGVVLMVIDLHHHRLPDLIVLPLYPVTVIGLVVAGLLSGRWAVWSALAGAGVWTVVVGVPWLVSGGRGMGFGDVKLAPVLGATLGWISVPVAVAGLVLAFLLGAAVSIVLLVTRRADRRTALPFGPALLAGALLAVLVGTPLVDLYLGISFPQ